jgi:hypothetical protein
MAEFATIVISDTSPSLEEGDSHVIRFRPLRPGPVNIRSTPHPQTSPLRSEFTPPELGNIELRAPGRPKPLKTAAAPLNATLLGLGYDTTAADLAVAGDWTCTIFNGTLNSITFETEINYLSDYELQTASFDLEMLNLLLGEATALATPSVHLETSPPDQPDATDEEKEENKKTFVSWSSVVANLLPAPLKGTTEYRTHVDDPQPQGHSYRIVGLNARSTQVFAPGNNELVVRFTFDGQKSALKELDSLAPGIQEDIDIDSLVVDLHVGFDGKIRPKCQASASLQEDSFADAALHVLDDTIKYFQGDSPTDVSGETESEFEQKIAEQINGLVSQDTIKQAIDSFFIRLMRLEAGSAPAGHEVLPGVISAGEYHAKVQSYSTDGALVVTYYLVQEFPVLSEAAVAGASTTQLGPPRQSAPPSAISHIGSPRGPIRPE